MNLLTRLRRTSAPAGVILIRLMVGGVFLSEGIQKFLFPVDAGAGRFARIGIPSPKFLAPFVGVVEIVCGTLILLGLVTRLAAIALLIDILVAIFSTKIPILLGHGFWRFSKQSRLLRFLGDAARGAYRCFDVAWSAVPSDCRTWLVVNGWTHYINETLVDPVYRRALERWQRSIHEYRRSHSSSYS